MDRFSYCERFKHRNPPHKQGLPTEASHTSGALSTPASFTRRVTDVDIVYHEKRPILNRNPYNDRTVYEVNMFRRQAIQIASASILANNVFFDPLEEALGAHTHPYPTKQLPNDAAPKHILATSLFGTEKLERILPLAEQLGIEHIDLWPKIHGSQREELTQMGEDRFAELIAKHKLQLGCITQFPLGPFGLADEIRLCIDFIARLSLPVLVELLVYMVPN